MLRKPTLQLGNLSWPGKELVSHAMVLFMKQCGGPGCCSNMHSDTVGGAEGQARADSLAKHLAENKVRQFWNGINHEQSSRVCNPTSIDGITGNENILKLWENHYKSCFLYRA